MKSNGMPVIRQGIKAQLTAVMPGRCFGAVVRVGPALAPLLRTQRRCRLCRPATVPMPALAVRFSSSKSSRVSKAGRASTATAVDEGSIEDDLEKDIDIDFDDSHLAKPPPPSTWKTGEPLRILYCGSDAFSCVSLRGLIQEMKQNPGLIKSIDVVTRAAKPVGRGMKEIRNPPIMDFALKHGLRVHAPDDLENWTPPLIDSEPINLVLAVSFGLFIPESIINSAKYGGFNIHPSLLPDLRGSAPLIWAMILKRPHTGVTLQTLSTLDFDRGVVLAQTARPGVPISPDETESTLRRKLATHGARILVRSLRQGLHIPPLSPILQQQQEQDEEAVQVQSGTTTPTPPATTQTTLDSTDASSPQQDVARPPSPPSFYARKIKPADRELRWDKLILNQWTVGDVSLRYRALGKLWATALVPAPATTTAGGSPASVSPLPPSPPKRVRVTFEGVTTIPASSLPPHWMRYLLRREDAEPGDDRVVDIDTRSPPHPSGLQPPLDPWWTVWWDVGAGRNLHHPDGTDQEPSSPRLPLRLCTAWIPAMPKDTKGAAILLPVFETNADNLSRHLPLPVPENARFFVVSGLHVAGERQARPAWDVIRRTLYPNALVPPLDCLPGLQHAPSLAVTSVSPIYQAVFGVDV